MVSWSRECKEQKLVEQKYLNSKTFQIKLSLPAVNFDDFGLSLSEEFCDISALSLTTVTAK